ncbi:MAG: hypothetical protein ACO1OT_01555 [Heyndrickxia sp.]
MKNELKLLPTWRPDGLQEFDARLYLTLDAAGDEIASTQVGDL